MVSCRLHRFHTTAVTTAEVCLCVPVLPCVAPAAPPCCPCGAPVLPPCCPCVALVLPVLALCCPVVPLCAPVLPLCCPCGASLLHLNSFWKTARTSRTPNRDDCGAAAHRSDPVHQRGTNPGSRHGAPPGNRLRPLVPPLNAGSTSSLVQMCVGRRLPQMLLHFQRASTMRCPNKVGCCCLRRFGPKCAAPMQRVFVHSGGPIRGRSVQDRSSCQAEHPQDHP